MLRDLTFVDVVVEGLMCEQKKESSVLFCFLEAGDETTRENVHYPHADELFFVSENTSQAAW